MFIQVRKSIDPPSSQPLGFGPTHRKLQHANIALLRSGCVTPPYISTLIEWGESGTLREFLQDPNQEMDQNLAIKFAKGVAQGMAYLHSQSPPVHHLNLKSSNILVRLVKDMMIQANQQTLTDLHPLQR